MQTSDRMRSEEEQQASIRTEASRIDLQNSLLSSEAENAAFGEALDCVLDLLLYPVLPFLQSTSLTLSQLRLLLFCHDAQRTSLSEACRRLKLSPARARKLLADLLKLGLLKRHIDACDRRRALLRPTRTGRELITAFENGCRLNLRAVLSDLTAEERAAVVSGLQMLIADPENFPRR